MYSRRKDKSIEGKAKGVRRKSEESLGRTLNHLEIGISKEWLRRLNGKTKISKTF